MKLRRGVLALFSVGTMVLAAVATVPVSAARGPHEQLSVMVVEGYQMSRTMMTHLPGELHRVQVG